MRFYVKPFLPFSRHACAVLAVIAAAGVAHDAVAQEAPDDDMPPPPLRVIESPEEARSVPVRSVTVTETGAVPGIPQAGGPKWVSQGPAPAILGQVERVRPDLNGDGKPDNEVTGAVHVILPHPTNTNIIYIGAVNGGVWKTTNATNVSPTWVPLTDFLPSLSIGALEFDTADPTHQTLVAGVGRFSSFGRVGGALTGLYKTTDGGATWTQLDGGGVLTGQNISAVYARGNFILAAATEFRPDEFSVDFTTSGLFRSFDGGTTFELLGQFPGPTTFRTGRVYDMEGHRNDPATIYAAVAQMIGGSGANGVYRSDDFGGTWTRVSSPQMNSLIVNGFTSNIELSMYNDGSNEVVYCAILNQGQLELGGVFRSTNRGVTWAPLPIPFTSEANGDVSTNPTNKPDAGGPGGQGAIHFSIEAHPTLPGVVFVGGDRQPAGAGDCCGFPNSIGANDFSGRLFRGDVFSPLADKWSHLTHSSSVITKPLGGTASLSAPHADSREIAFTANNSLVEADDGGVYRRTLATTNDGDWFSINGNLAVTEIHDIAWDAVSNVLVSGNQDTGTTYQRAPGSKQWISFRTADGGDVLIDDQSAFSSSTRYTSFQFLGNARRSTWLSSNVLLSDQAIAGAGYTGTPLFRTPLALNHIDPTRIVASSVQVVNESFNRGDNFAPLPLIVGSSQLEFTATTMDYGGVLDGEPNADVLWVGGAQPDPSPDPDPDFIVPNVLFRQSSLGGLTVTNYPGVGWETTERIPVDLEMDPTNARICYVADQLGGIFRTKDAGNTWVDVSTALGDVGLLYQIEFVRTDTSRYLFVCADLGVFFTDVGSLDGNPAAARWRELGTNLPNASVWDIEYEREDDVIAIGTMGRGAWTFKGVSDTLDAISPRASVYVDPNYTGTQLGTEGAPYRTIALALANVADGGTIFLAPGNYALSPMPFGVRARFDTSRPGIARFN